MCTSSESIARRINKDINKQLRTDHRRDSNALSMVIIGGDSSGKSTVAAHLRLLSAEVGLNSLDLVAVKLQLFVFLANHFEKLCTVATSYSLPLSKTSELYAGILRNWMGLPLPSVTQEVVHALGVLSSDSNIREAWNQLICDQSSFLDSGLSMGFHYFLELRMDSILSGEYVPTAEDWLHIPTTTQRLISVAPSFSGFFEPANRAEFGLTFSISECGSLPFLGYRRLCLNLDTVQLVVLTICLADFNWKECIGMGQSCGPYFRPFRDALDIFEMLIMWCPCRILIIFTGFDILAAKLKRHSFHELYGHRMNQYTLKNEHDATEVAEFLIKLNFERNRDSVEYVIMDPASPTFQQRWKRVVSSFIPDI